MVTPHNLRELYQELVAARTATTRAECPSIDVLSDIAEGETTERERLAVLDHVLQCSHCKREFDQLRAVAATRPSPPRLLFAQRLALAAGVLLAVSGPLAYWVASGRDAEDRFRSGSSDVTLVSPVANAELGPGRTLVWRAVPGTESYLVEILDSADAVVYSVAVADTMAIVPNSIVLVRGAPYDWWVRARGADGREARSMLVPFRGR